MRLWQAAEDEAVRVFATNLRDPRHLGDSPDLAQLPEPVRDAINIVTPLSLTYNAPALDTGPLSATAVPEPTTSLLLLSVPFLLPRRRRR